MNKVAILDAGSQFGKLIDRRLHEIGIESVLLPLNSEPEKIKNYGAFIITGSPGSVNEKDAATVHPEFFDKINKPILGICYGIQLINKLFGGIVETLDTREDGQSDQDVDLNSNLFAGLISEKISPNTSGDSDLGKATIKALLTHGERISQIAPNFNAIATACGVVTGIQHENRPIYGVQFHPEVNLTPKGKFILKSFVQDIAGLECCYTIDCREQICCEEIKSVVGDNKLIILVSGGVDSSVLATLCQKALGPEKSQKQIIALHIDHGFMRKNESEIVKEKLTKLGVNLIVVKAHQDFMCATTEVMMKSMHGRDLYQETEQLCYLTDPEHKRHVIGDTFIRVVRSKIASMGYNFDDCFLAQGTLRPDLIESASTIASSNAACIKTHHNDSKLVRHLRKKGQVLEPLRNFHKDEVRELGRKLGLSSDFVDRHPFPGPGLAIRIICHNSVAQSLDPKNLKKVIQAATAQNTGSLIKTFVRYAHAEAHPNLIFTQLRDKLSPEYRAKLSLITGRLPKLSAILLPFRTVGVQGDGRTYNLCAAITLDKTPEIEKMMETCQFWEDMYAIATMLPNVAHYVNRVVFVFTDQAIDDTPEFTTHTRLTQQTIQQLQEADYIALNLLRKYNVYNKIAQMPVVLTPIDFQANDQSRFGFGYKYTSAVLRSVCLRPFISDDFMTGVPALPVKDIPIDCIREMVKTIEEKVVLVSKVMIDLTPKPPGTTEWE